MTRKTWYKRIMLENIAAVVIWGIATGGIAWAILLAAKIFFNIHLGIWTNIYDTTDPKEEPIPATIFSKEIFLSRFLGLPILLILIILVVAAIFFFGILFMGVLNNAFR